MRPVFGQYVNNGQTPRMRKSAPINSEYTLSTRCCQRGRRAIYAAGVPEPLLRCAPSRGCCNQICQPGPHQEQRLGRQALPLLLAWPMPARRHPERTRALVSSTLHVTLPRCSWQLPRNHRLARGQARPWAARCMRLSCACCMGAKDRPDTPSPDSHAPHPTCAGARRNCMQRASSLSNSLARLYPSLLLPACSRT